MRKVTLVRPQKMQFLFTKGKVLLDGSECAVVKAGKSVEFEIPDGSHSIQVHFPVLPPISSNTLFIEQTDGDSVFEVKINVPLKNTDSTTAELTKK